MPPDISTDFDEKDTLIGHPRFASGSIFSSSCLGALIARAYYTPGIIELVEALVNGRRQTSYPWQIAIPSEFSGGTYGDLVQGLMKKEPGGALCLGLYRKCWKGASLACCYVLTNPDPTTPLDDDDMAIMLAPDSMGKEWWNENAMVPVRGAPGADDPEDAIEPSEASAQNSARPSQVDPAEDTAGDTGNGTYEDVRLPSLPSLQNELDDTRKMLAESLRRESDLHKKLLMYEPIMGLPEPHHKPAAANTGRAWPEKPEKRYPIRANCCVPSSVPEQAVKLS